jgi:mRNA interferase MazF
LFQLEQFDVVKVPFPFTELPFTKRRPAVVLSESSAFHFVEGVPKTVLCMITSSKHKPWPLDTPLTGLKAAGLSQESLIRLKIFTLDTSLVLAKIGRLVEKDGTALKKNLSQLFSLSPPPGGSVA